MSLDTAVVPSAYWKALGSRYRHAILRRAAGARRGGDGSPEVDAEVGSASAHTFARGAWELPSPQCERGEG